MKTRTIIILSILILTTIIIMGYGHYKQRTIDKKETSHIITEDSNINEVEHQTNEEIKTNIEDVEEGFTEQELLDMEYVDTKIQQLVETEQFKQASLNDRSVLVLSLLKVLKDDGYVKNIYYETDNTVISFEYSCDVIGGVMIKEWDKMMN